MSGVPTRAEEPTYEPDEGGSTLRVYLHDGAELDDFLTIEVNDPADSVRLSWGDAVELCDALRDAIGMGTFKQDALLTAERRGAVKALRVESKRGVEAVEAANQREGIFKDFAVHLMTGLSQELARRADAIESGEVTL